MNELMRRRLPDANVLFGVRVKILTRSALADSILCAEGIAGAEDITPQKFTEVRNIF